MLAKVTYGKKEQYFFWRVMHFDNIITTFNVAKEIQVKYNVSSTEVKDSQIIAHDVNKYFLTLADGCCFTYRWQRQLLHQKTNTQVSFRHNANHKKKTFLCYDELSSKSTRVYSFAVNIALSQLCSHFLD